MEPIRGTRSGYEPVGFEALFVLDDLVLEPYDRPNTGTDRARGGRPTSIGGVGHRDACSPMWGVSARSAPRSGRLERL
jgi:hypothetical protein